jgi:AraC-like DNA-binding protein
MAKDVGKHNRAERCQAAPAVSLPKGGGAVRGIGEKFTTNPVTGTGSISVPVATSPGRSGFAPELALTYDSGAGNDPFGFGWTLSLQSTTRKTDKVACATGTSGTEVRVFLRPEWVYRVAREVETFVATARIERTSLESVEGFLSSLPVSEGEFEYRLVEELRRRLLSLAPRRPDTPAERAQQILISQYQKPWRLRELAREVGCNRTTLQEGFRRLTRTSVHQFLVHQRVSVAQRLLAESDLKVSRIAQEVGYSSHSALARHFKNVTGTTLTNYRVRKNGSAVRGPTRVERAPLTR